MKKITQVKFKKCFFNSGKVNVGNIASLSLELAKTYDQETKKMCCKRIVTCEYYAAKDQGVELKSKVAKKLFDENYFDDLFNKINNLELANLKNNYFTAEGPDMFTHWELEYNFIFKVVGTYDQEPKEVTEVENIINFNDIKNEFDVKDFQ
jgi:hypothetical protein